MKKKRRGELLIIGGNEKKNPADEEQAAILRHVARAATGNGRLVILTVASSEPEEMERVYRAAFARLGVKHFDCLDIRTREEAVAGKGIEKLDGASVLFFTGGDQLRITSLMGGTPVMDHIFGLHEAGAAIVGTSAGAAAAAETMLGFGESNVSRLTQLTLAPGLGLLKGVIIDQHFAERGRFGRLMGAVAQNPHSLGIGIDEDTAIHVMNDEEFTVLGSGAVYVFDATGMTYTSLSDRHSEGILTVHDTKVHMLGRGDRFSLVSRRPLPH
ncbi:cyanophycinase [Pyxidicoccus fallax]|uniref:Cyanophycinase n=1 Tax=Pyxidicoccus fallax TaxID=394095 RepID=A0A848LFE7_9BACT|nr:cyanophycinase [Pyxidicoccus fallax]NMO15041.1 cyanophycinase [Pyxidicoccus fallax]NPC78063.1 cyanophycinase [Pyxidicoccus fallax]